MEVTIIILLLYTLIIFFNFIPVVKCKEKKEIWIYSVALAVSFGVLVINSLGYYLPSPTQPIKAAINAIFMIK